MSSPYKIRLLCLLLPVLLPVLLHAQILNNNLDPTTQQQNMFNQAKDSLKTTTEWKEETARIYYNYLNSAVSHYPDSSLNSFHRFQPQQPWWVRDLGNIGTAAYNQLFSPAMPFGLSLGYHAYDPYRFRLDSLQFFNTTRPYSAFTFMLGSKSEQNAEILHTQNINPNWNFATRIKYLTSHGFYYLQKANSISGSVSTNYQSKNQRYYLAAGMVYNRFKQHENGGILNESLLDSSAYSDRQLIPVALPSFAGTDNAAVTNILRDCDIYVQNNYSFGQADTLYNKDSTEATYRFTPRFRIKHQLQLHTEKHSFRDVEPGSNRYRPLTIDSIPLQSSDSVYSVQSWFYVDNKVSLNGFIGKRESLVQLEAGVGNRIDRFNTDYATGRSPQSSIGNYLFGEIKKEAFREKQWSYQAAAALFLTGDAAGNFDIKAGLGKDIGKWGMFAAGLRQNLSNPGYTFTTFRSNIFDRNYLLDKTSITQLWARVSIDRIKVQLEVKNDLVANYVYLDKSLVVQQQKDAFSVLRIYGRKEFRFGIFSLDNEAAWQQPTANAPVNLPTLLLRHKLALETNLFRKALRVAAGLDIRYHTNYKLAGYTPYFNQFYYQDTYTSNNAPECAAFFNFKVKSFRAFIIVDQLQQFVSRNVINAPGYPGQNALFRFGFTWILIN